MISANSVLVANPNPGHVSTDFATSVFRMWRHDQENAQRIEDLTLSKFGPDLTLARNSLVHAFLSRSNLEWLLQIDSDMSFPEDVLDRMNPWTGGEGNRQILGGVCPILHGGVTVPHPEDPSQAQSTVKVQHISLLPNAFWWKTDAEGKRVLVTTNRPDNPSRLPVVPCDGIGAAFLLVHRDVFVQMRKELPYPHWFGPVYLENEHASEDLGFCIRAKQCGFQTWAVTRLGVRHEKSVMLDEVRW